MDSPDNAGSSGPSGKLFRHADLFGLAGPNAFERAWNRTDIEGTPYFKSQGFAELAKTIAKGSRAIEAAILRRWGVR